jgi:putative tryptophan/tyrosine transport system substrate-binding protein
VRRREFIAGLGGAAAWPVVAARAQQPERIRRIGLLMSAAIETDQPAAVAAFVQVLQQLGWSEGRNVRIDIRWARGDPAEARRYAEELIGLASDVIMPSGQVALEALLQATRTVPIVFNQIADPVGAGYVDTLARPGGNATGFIQFDYTLAGKWLELLKQIAPNVTRAAVLRDPAIAAGVGQFAVIQSVALSVGMQVSAINLHDAGEIERAITRFAGSPNGGLIVTTSALSAVHHDLIIALAARHKLPAVYYRRYFVTLGGLISYGYDIFQQFRDTAGYVDRILKGEKPADLPVQAPTKYELAINLKTAKALGLDVPHSLLARADEVIE